MIFVFLYLAYITQYYNLYFIHVATNGIISFFFLWLILHEYVGVWVCGCVCVCVSHLLHPFTCQLLFRLSPCLDYCEYQCSEHWNACFILNYGFLWIYTWEWYCWIICWLYLQLFKDPPYFIVASPIYVPTSSVGECPFLHSFSRICCLQTF